MGRCSTLLPLIFLIGCGTVELNSDVTESPVVEKTALLEGESGVNAYSDDKHIYDIAYPNTYQRQDEPSRECGDKYANVDQAWVDFFAGQADRSQKVYEQTKDFTDKKISFIKLCRDPAKVYADACTKLVDEIEASEKSLNKLTAEHAKSPVETMGPIRAAIELANSSGCYAK